MEYYPLVKKLHIDVGILGISSMDFVEPHTIHPKMICGLANAGSHVVGPSNYIENSITGESPSSWQECTSQSTRQTYLLDQFTRQSQWDRPMELTTKIPTWVWASNLLAKLPMYNEEEVHILAGSEIN